MFDAYFSRFYRFVHQHKPWVLGLVLLITLLAGVGLTRISYDGSIDFMLPPEPEIRRSMDFLRDSSLTDKMVVSLALTDSAKTKQDLFLAADQLAASLTPPFFTKVINGISVGDVMEEFSILRYAPQVLGTHELAVLDKRINTETVSQKMREIYRQSLRPESVFMSSMSRTDPIGIKTLLQDKLRALPASMGYDVAVEDGHFISRDGRHTMLIIQTPIPMMDSQRSGELVATLQEKLKSLPAFVSADIISGHLHTVNNERVIMRDITVASIVASIAFFFLFLFVFRDARAFFVFIFPFIAVIWAIILTGFIETKLSYLVIGFGTAIVGISDYGLIVYIALKRGTADVQMEKLAKLVFIDAITTIFSFVVLFFSLIRGYHQLALFSVLCLFICLFFSLFVLPLTLTGKRAPMVADPTIGDRLKKFRWPTKLTVGTWIVLTLIFLFFAFSVQFDSDVKKLDGSGPDVFLAEQRFHDVWGGKTNQAIFVVTGKSLEEAMETNDRVFRDAVRVLGNTDFTSLALFWPSEKLRKENQAHWDSFWMRGRESRLKELINAESVKYGFSDRAFTPFFDGLYDHKKTASPASGFTSQMMERFVVQKNGEYRIMSFFPDEQRHVETLGALTKTYPGTFIVSGKTLSASISDFTMKEMKFLVPLAVLFNVVLSWLFFRNWKETFIALVPLITGVIWLLGIMSLFKMPLNMVNIIAGIIASGVIVDYGLGITYEYSHNLHFGTVMAMTLSAASNVIGAGALLFAQHPALYSTGVAMVICMVIGYLSSVMVIPSLCSLLGTSKREEATE
jgi:predicted exporter